MKYLSIIILALAFFIMGCGHYIESNGSYTPPSLKSQPRLFYPMAAYEKAYTGTPKVILYISKDGNVAHVAILKSSGIGILDSAALEYSKNFVFIPAKRNGKPVSSRMAMDIKFKLSIEKWNAANYVNDVNDLYGKFANAVPENRNEIEKQILEKHNEFVTNMKDLSNYNRFIGMVIKPDIYKEWKNDWDSWPLSFLLFHDFIQRFPDYTNLDRVKEELKNSLRYDIQYIKITPSQNKVSVIEKEILVSKIRNLVENKYPDMINDIGLDAKIDSLSVF